MIYEWRGDTLYKFEKESSTLRLGDSWTINLDVIGDKEPSKVVYETATRIYSIPFSVARARGFERTVQGERKLVVPKKNWQVIEK